MKKMPPKIAGVGAWMIAAIVAVVTALGTVATLGVAANVNGRIERASRQIDTSCDLNESMKSALGPTIGLNEKAGVVQGYIKDILRAMTGMRNGLVAMVNTVEKTNGVLAGVREHTEKLIASLNQLIPYINQLADAVDTSNMASEASLAVLDQINSLNSQIAGQMAQMRNKLAGSTTYMVLFKYAMPVLP
ncbi:MAG: hypothetical protein KKF41_10435 [Actinobacteria bacterium]|nr:hypothetical protein [Actinomycetota bacterium]MBU1943062.1 hypothetical protein [Actinomycetota bacterium]MBU2687991.1 hypothetical protein [Actinomycetota bacterium]